MMCYNDDSVSDVDEDTCSNYYDSNPDACGNFDDEGFTAANSCCACGGGIYGSYEDSSDDDYEVCESDVSVADIDGDTCSSYYDLNPEGCGGYDTEDFIAARECCACGGGSTGYYEDSSDDDMWYWMNYLTNDEVDGYGVIWTYDQELNEFELAFTGGEMDSWCTLTTDWKTDDMEDGAWGFFVTATYGDEYCSFVEDEGWVYASLTSDEEGNPLTLEGPYGN
jgi:hypothetical protein